MNTRMMFARVVAGAAMAMMFSSVACASEQSNDGGLAWTPLSISLFGCEKMRLACRGTAIPRQGWMSACSLWQERVYMAFKQIFGLSRTKCMVDKSVRL